ncbi:MAG TPA: hypothetical protein VJB35_05460 [Candidatus Nanoarchaeia archaeon]|nr:hypothetical protein [Candidatus Nanoarchaeia archaeon]
MILLLLIWFVKSIANEEINLNIHIIESNDKETFFISMFNSRNSDIKEIYATIEIYNIEEQKILTLKTNKTLLKSLEQKEFILEWQANVNPGKYEARIIINYDGQIITTKKEFNVQENYLEAVEIKVNDFKLGNIITFNTLIKNKWSSNFKQISLEIIIYNDKEEIFAKAESQKYNIQGLSQTQTVTQLNTKNLEPGVYDTILILKYGEKTTEQKIKLNITQNNIEFIGITGKTIEIIQEDKFYKNKGILWILGIGIILIINIIALILLKRKIK